MARHAKHGFLVMRARKRSKGDHGQLPGGRVDVEAGELPREAAAREMREETGMDGPPSRLAYVCDVAGKRFFALKLRDEDALASGNVGVSLPVGGESFPLRLSEEHTGFMFVATREAAARAVMAHSGGHPADALLRLDEAAVFGTSP